MHHVCRLTFRMSEHAHSLCDRIPPDLLRRLIDPFDSGTTQANVLKSLLSNPTQWFRGFSVVDALTLSKIRSDVDPHHLVVLDFDNTLFCLKGDAWTLGLSTDFNTNRLERITSPSVIETVRSMDPSRYIVVTRKNQEGADEALEILQDLYPEEQKSKVRVIRSMTDDGCGISKATLILDHMKANQHTSVSFVDDGQSHLETLAADLKDGDCTGWLFLVDLMQDMKAEQGITPEQAQNNVTLFFSTMIA